MPGAELSLLFLRPLNQLGVRYIVSGGVASILYGEPRFTNDVDLVEFLREGGSDKHVRDIQTMLKVSRELINQADLSEWIRRRGVEAEWEKVAP